MRQITWTQISKAKQHLWEEVAEDRKSFSAEELELLREGFCRGFNDCLSFLRLHLDINVDCKN